MAEKTVRTPLVIALGVVVLLVIGFFGYRLISSDGDSDSSASSASSSSTTVGANGSDGSGGASTTSTTVPGEPVTPGQSFDAFVTKNPFQPLVSATAASTGTGTNATTPTTATTVPVNSGTVAPAVPANQAPSASTPVSLLEVFDDGGVVRARIQVGVTVYTVAAGETFATSYKVVSLDLGAQCGQFQFGDSPFQLCVGEQTLK